MFNVGMMTSYHVVYIPMVAFVGIVIGYLLGARAVRREHQRRRQRLKQ